MPDAKSNYSKTQILDKMVDFCSEPKTNGDILDTFKHMRSYKSIQNYLTELIQEGLLFRVPLSTKGPKWGYLNFKPSQQQLLTGKYLMEDEKSPLKLFRTDPTVTGEGLTAYPGLDIVFSHSPVVGEVWKTVHACLLVIGYGYALEKASLARRAQINLAFWELLTIVKTLYSVLEQISKEQAVFDFPEVMAEKFGFEAVPEEEIAAAWKRLVEKQLIKGDPQALYRAMPKNEDEAS